ncbi:lasso peptide biosynthesis B2 protein [Terricaulis silvestris]|uniref:Microcin J25-processing protein McjB C-terminal domain-containing protein n=1 Tax=Terricaulis silvestris TaxID=2686094 RepID=A0A6I6MKA1_9CAUL|nr:lasso peptide biosynthesis B2 protein [Terricaulis silvestris]QGZ93384.1 hypothetical protein DSM104635_00194 [Terricaulis silvestris]
MRLRWVFALTPEALDDLISAVLRKEDVSWLCAVQPEIDAAFVRRASDHGVVPLLNERLAGRSDWPASIKAALRHETLAQAMWELRHHQVLTLLFQAFAGRGVEPVVFKGAALAYDLYANPVLRTRGDADIIVASEDLEDCRDTLRSQGFRLDPALPGEFVSHQESWTLLGPDGDTHSIDLHRRINNSEVLSSLFSYAELRGVACPIPKFCVGAMRASRVHALLIACMHRLTHRHAPYYSDGVALYGGDRLIWVYDFHVLASALTGAEWAELVSIAREKGLASVCLEALHLSEARFNTNFPEHVRAQLSRPGADERASVYLRSSSAQQLQLDFFALRGVGAKLQFVREVTLPPPDYMRSKYAGASFSLLPWLYVRRVIEGAGKRLLGPRSLDRAARPTHKRRIVLWGELAWWERLLLARLVVLLALIGTSLRVIGYSKTRASLERLSSPHSDTLNSDATNAEAIGRIARLVSIAANHGLYRAKCLPQSLALWWLLRRRGTRAELRFGVRRERDELDAHAWVEFDGVVLNGDARATERFAVLETS